MPRTPPSQWGALFNFAGGGLIHQELFALIIVSTENPTLFEAIAHYLLPYGVHADRPTATDTPEGALFLETDTQEIYQNEAGAWVLVANVGSGGGGSPGGSNKNVQYNNAGAFGGVTNNTTATKKYLQQVSTGTPSFDQINGADLVAASIGPTELAATAVTPGAYGDATHVPAITIDADGRITAAADVAISGGGGGTLGGARVTHNTTQSIPNATDTAAAFNTEDYDTDNYHDNATNNSRLTAPATGTYLVGFCLQYDSASPTGPHYGSIKLNTTTTPLTTGFGNSEYYPFITGSTVIEMSAGDYVQIWTNQSTGGSQNLLSATDYVPIFWIERLR